MSLLDDLEALLLSAKAAFASVSDAKSLETVRVEYLSKSGKVKAVLGRLGEVAKEDRPRVGQRANAIQNEILAAFEEARNRLGGETGRPGTAAAKPAGGQKSADAPTTSDAKSYEVLRQERLDKLQRYNAAMEQRTGEKDAAWGGRFPDRTPIAEARALFPPLGEGEQPGHDRLFGHVRIAARVMLRRDQSKKLIFLTVQDQDAQIQVALWNQKLSEETLALLRDTLDLWDIVGVEGDLAYTQRGEPTLWATDIRILGKCLAPPPDKFHGLQDKELRYRQRYLDLIASFDARKTFVLRSKAVSRIRRFLDDRGFLEQETPALQTIPGGAAARPFKTHLNALDVDMYLRIATEIPLKKLLVGGLERVYELGRLFRNEGVDSRHNPEFTTVEIYQAYGDLRDMMELTETLLVTLAQELRGTTKLPYRGREVDVGLRVDLGNGRKGWPRLDYCELLKRHAGVACDDESGLDAKLKEKGLDPRGLTLVDKIDGVFGEYCEPHLWDACFVINQPVEMSPLCKAHPRNPRLADRFEAFAGEMEIANAYSELNDAREQRRRLVAQPRDLWLKTLGDLSAFRLPGVVRMGVDRLISRIRETPDWHATEEQHDAVRRLLESDDPEVRAAIAKHRENLSRLLDPESAVDEDFLNALDHGMPPAGGLGIGIDRIMMLLTSNDSIRDVIPFPFMRPEGTSIPEHRRLP